MISFWILIYPGLEALTATPSKVVKFEVEATLTEVPDGESNADNVVGGTFDSTSYMVTLLFAHTFRDQNDLPS